MNKQYNEHLYKKLNEFEQIIKENKSTIFSRYLYASIKLEILRAFDLASQYKDFDDAINKIIFKRDFPVSNDMEEIGKSKSYLPEEFTEKFLEKFLKTY